LARWRVPEEPGVSSAVGTYLGGGAPSSAMMSKLIVPALIVSTLIMSTAILSTLLISTPVAAAPDDGVRTEMDAGPKANLQFSRHGLAVATRSLEAMQSEASIQRTRVFEPYEEVEMAFLGIPFASVLDAVYGPSWRQEEELLFTCSDGYQPTLPIQRVLDRRAWLAFDRPGEQGFSVLKFESGKRRRIELAPFYLIWENLEDLEVRQEGDYGWPYQLIAVDLIRASDRYPKMTPNEGTSPDVLAGFSAFRVHCSRCHTINGEGGSIGPELNIPTNPAEYRDAAWLQKWIDDPATLSPNTRMPRLNPALANRARTIDHIISYLAAISSKKISPTRQAENGS
jgi:mono/diheme cytochrome c family protein